MSEYALIESTNFVAFHTACNKYLKLGWIPQGGVSVSTNDRSQNTIYVQAFVK